MSPKQTVLVVDDEETIRKLLSAQLQQAGYTVLVAPDGEEALAQVEQNAVDLAIVDIIMPGKDGIQTITNLRITRPELKIIAMSGDADSEFYLEAANRLGVRQRLKKPFEFEELARAISAVGAREN